MAPLSLPSEGVRTTLTWAMSPAQVPSSRRVRFTWGPTTRQSLKAALESRVSTSPVAWKSGSGRASGTGVRARRDSAEGAAQASETAARSGREAIRPQWGRSGPDQVLEPVARASPAPPRSARAREMAPPVQRSTTASSASWTCGSICVPRSFSKIRSTAAASMAGW